MNNNFVNWISSMRPYYYIYKRAAQIPLIDSIWIGLFHQFLCLKLRSIDFSWYIFHIIKRTEVITCLNCGPTFLSLIIVFYSIMFDLILMSVQSSTKCLVFSHMLGKSRWILCFFFVRFKRQILVHYFVYCC